MKYKQYFSSIIFHFSLGNSRVVRKLLIKGADRFIRDKNNKTPMDLAKDNEYNNIMGLLVNYLKIVSNLKSYNIARPKGICYILQH